MINFGGQILFRLGYISFNQVDFINRDLDLQGQRFGNTDPASHIPSKPTTLDYTCLLRALHVLIGPELQLLDHLVFVDV